jgi:ubiquinone/menaquinone biosynthesis C-methylase UbiE
VRTDTVRALLPRVVDDGWFFDTELLVLAWRAGFRIHEVPVQWEEDLDSRVKIVKTALADLRGIWRLARQPRPRRSASSADHAEGSLAVSSDGSARPNGVARSEGQTMNSPDLRTETTSFDFDALAPQYVQSVDESVSFTGRNSAFFASRKVDLLEQIAAKAVGQLSSLSVLDVGCGTGTTSSFLVDRCQSLVGVDVSKEMLDQAARTVPEASFTWYGGKELPFPDGRFDVSLAVCVLHHVVPAERRSFVAELYRVTRPGGLVAVFEHNPLNPLTRRAVSTCELDNGVVLLSQSDTRRLMQGAGVRSVRTEYFLFTPLGGRRAAAFDHVLRSLPMGGQYVSYGIARP